MKVSVQVIMGLFVILPGHAVLAVGSAAVSTTVYVGRHFEVRNDDESVKYVFHGDNRVARITGSLTPTLRIQQLRLWQGWNLVSLAVSATNILEQLSRASTGSAGLSSAYFLNTNSGNFETVGASRALPSGSILWLKAATNYIAKAVGAYVEPTASKILPEGAWLSGTGFERWSPDLPGAATLWQFDAFSGAWQPTFGELLASPGQPRPMIAPGEPVYIHTAEPIELLPVAPELRLAYYHQDHLGSSALVTDAAGGLVQEAAYYPFGAKRHEEQLCRLETHYGFSQKERDDESGLQYFGQRYQHAALGRWISTDPLGESGGGPNPYAAVDNNPLKLHDPDGAEIKVIEKVKGNTVTYHIQLKAVLIDSSSTKIDQKQLAAYQAKLVAQIQSSYQGKGKGWVQLDNEKKPRMMNIKWDATASIRVVSSWSEVQKDDHVFRIVDRTQNNSSGDTHTGAMLINLAADIFQRPTPDQFNKVKPIDPRLPWSSFHQPEGVGAHEFGHAAGLSHASYDQNLMTDGQKQHYKNIKIEQSQIRTIVEAYKAGGLNQRDADLDALTKSK